MVPGNPSPIYVTQPSLAPLEELNRYLQHIWSTGVMTHNGPLVQQLERELADYLGLDDVVCVVNGTAALQLAIRALDIAGEVITTPFTFIATANIIAWERCIPVFVDIDPDTWNIDAAQIEARITDKTAAILPVHVFSNPSDIESIEAIAKKHRLPVIYDAAHAMAVNYRGRSILSRGDVNCVSFHATKLFNTGEGGACIAQNTEVAARIRRMRFFGFNENKEIVDDGMNGKMTEISAGLGLANLAHLNAVIRNRRYKYELYQALLRNCEYVTFQKFQPDEYNYSYMPIIFDTTAQLLDTMRKLNAENIFPRRYFYPSLHNVKLFESPFLPVAERIATTVLCLPLYDQLADSDIERICNTINKSSLAD